ncbi:MAG TPA: CehA/McbA family metallohydrolase [Terriglobia bacterium]|nr:CehA/McbA family metallohydrolase [Terriglobia bacterium]
MKLRNSTITFAAVFWLCLGAGLQPGILRAAPGPQVPLQPFSDSVREVERDLTFFGQPLLPKDQQGIDAAFANPDPQEAVAKAEAILDKYTIATVTVNPEERVDVARGPAAANLVQDGTRLFLVKIVNQAGVTAPLEVTSPNSGPVYITSTGNPSPKEKLTPADVRERWAEISLLSRTLEPPGYPNAPPQQRLSGFGLEYRILMIYSRDTGQRSAKLSFSVGQGTQDVGFLNEMTVLFKIAPARPITLHVYDENNRPSMASFIFRDSYGRIYPNPAKRLAPDFYFQPQIYRFNGERISLPAGSYNVTYTGGPEYLTETRKFAVNAHGPGELSFHLKRWIDPAKYGWYSGDVHIHPAGCSHYENPSEGVSPQDMDRQVRGEHLNVGCTLIWGPCYYYQKQFFSGKDNPASRPGCLLHYDVEVSGFPSSHCGHLVLLGLKNQNYPGTKRIDDWPTWDLPILRWAKSQGATVGFAHSGWGLKVAGTALPNYQIPGYDGIGANEYIVDVTYPNTVNFMSVGDTPYVWELNMWYQTLNVGFRTRIAGETDFPCIYDTRVGVGRTYAKVHGPLTYDNWLAAVRDGASYVSDGRSDLMDLKINGVEAGTHGSEVDLSAPGTVHLQITTAAYLDPVPDEHIHHLPYDEKPYWSLERARIEGTRKVPVEVVVNGEPAARQEIIADGTVRTLRFDVPLHQSSWVAVRILPSSHTNPIFVIVGGRPVRASRRSAEWCLAGVNQCWIQKSPLISKSELPAAKNAYDHAREVYRQLIAQCPR